DREVAREELDHVAPDRALPCVLEMGEPVGGPDERRTVAEHRIREADPVRSRHEAYRRWPHSRSPLLDASSVPRRRLGGETVVNVRAPLDGVKRTGGAPNGLSSKPPPYPRTIRVVLLAERAPHAALLERDDHEVLKQEQHEGHEPHEPRPDDQGGADGHDERAEVHRIARPAKRAARDENGVHRRRREYLRTVSPKRRDCPCAPED